MIWRRLLLLQLCAVSCCCNLHKEEYCCCKFWSQVTTAQCCCCCCWVLVVHFAAHDNTTVADAAAAGEYTHTHLHTHTISLANPLTHSLKLHTHTLSLVCLFSLLLAVFCVHCLHLRRSYVCDFALSTNAYATGTPTPRRIGELLFKPIYFHLNVFKFWFACAPSSLCLVLTPFFGFFVYIYV